MIVSNSTDVYVTGDWISDSTSYFISVVIVQLIFKVPARLFGVFTNIWTLLVFWKCGMRDGISVCFMALTLSDALCLTASLMGSMLAYMDLELNVKPYVNLYYVSYIFPFYGLMFYNISTMITMFLAIQKCCCIALPWNFQNYFSKLRCVATVFSIYCVGIILYIPFTVTAFPFQPTFDYSTNSTRLTFPWSYVYLNDIFPVLKSINYISIPFIGEIVILISTVILTAKLRESARFRYSVSAQSGFVSNNDEKNLETLSKKSAQNNCMSPLNTLTKSETINSSDVFTKSDFLREQTLVNVKSKKDVNSVIHSMSKKEVRATLAVNVVAILFVASNTPDVIVFLGSLLIPQFSAFGMYYNTFKLCIELVDLLHVLNLSVNLFVYLKFNTRFSETFKTMFTPCSK